MKMLRRGRHAQYCVLHGRYAGLNMDKRMFAVCSAWRICLNRVWFYLSGQRTRRPILRIVHAVCECVNTNHRDRLQCIHSESTWTTRCWADMHELHA